LLLARLTAGTVFTGDPQFTRPFDNGDVGAIRVNGAEGSNEFTMNGMSNTGQQFGGGNRVVAYIPPSDSVQEFKMTTSSFSAASGHSAGGNIDFSTKSGSSALHGSAYEFFRTDKWAANDFFSNHVTPKIPRSQVAYNRFGGTLGGPVFLPKIYDGRKHKTFFFLAGEGLLDAFPEKFTGTVPTLAERQGDFSALLPNVLIYDPLTTTADPKRKGHVIRTPFPGNIIPSNRFSPIALNILKFYPLPNLSGTAEGVDNFSSPQTRSDAFHTYLVRIDHLLSPAQRLSGTHYANWRYENRFDWARGFVSGLDVTGRPQYLANHGISLDDAITLSPTTVLDIRGGFTRLFTQIFNPTIGQIGPAQLGFSSSALGVFRPQPTFFPPFAINGYSNLNTATGGTTFENIYSNVYSFQPILTKVLRSHTLSFGYDYRAFRDNFQGIGNSEGTYTFDTNFTQQKDDSSGDRQGEGLAAFLLGQPTGGSIDVAAARANQAIYNGVFVQDDWKVLPRLTLNLGLRYEYEGATTERHDRNLRGFDFTSPSPIQGPAVAAFQKSFPSGIVVEPGKPPITSLNVVGGPLFAGAGQRGFWNPDPLNFQPRLGAAYQLTKSMVVRGGWGIYSVPFGLTGIDQTGFARTTQLVPSNDNGLTFQADLSNPFPGGVLQPSGSSLGLATNLGQNIAAHPLNVKTGHTQRWSLDVQYELPGQWLLDAAYVGSHGYDLARNGNFSNAIPATYLSTSPIRDDATIAALTASVTNPFAGLLPGSGINGKTIAVSQLLRPFPEFSNISSTLYNGSNNFNAAEVRVQHRFGHGYQLFATYTWSKLLERFAFLNDFETTPSHSLSGNDVPHRVTTTFIGQLPFGHGRHWGRNWSGVVEQLFGGWQTGAVFQFQSGQPIGLGNIVYLGNSSKLRTHISGSTVGKAFDTSGFYFSDSAVTDPITGLVNPSLQRNDPRINLSNNIRIFPVNLGNFRGSAQNNIDLNVLKTFSITERERLELRAVALNAFNHAQLGNPNVNPRSSAFGTITSQRGLPRELELALRFVF
jgi:hypothetical protein